MILVTAATGQLGTATVNYLLEKIPASQIAVLARDADKAKDFADKGISVRIGNYHDYESLVPAFKGVEKLLLISSNDFEDRAGQHINAIKAAKEAGVKHIAYTSVEATDPRNSATGVVGTSHADTDDFLKASGLTYTLLKDNLYADVIPMFVGDQVLTTGVFFPAGDGKVPFATREDMALAAAVVLTTEGHENKEYVIANDESWSFADVAQYISEVSGVEVTYTSPDAEVYKKVLEDAGVPDIYVWMLGAFAKAIKDHEFETGKSDLEQLIGKKPTTLKEYLATVYGK
ncbi:SDR family oxidoreductase [Flavobacterium psychrotrophum]|uniref:SDR family oxidoreductase n=1 Tax=Flavobacterium psychrotrophum TaxID=2294119 RepID=UPI000E319632|nr:SDR family oxidoreductase [Flavobacterium psychrotrophum]